MIYISISLIVELTESDFRENSTLVIEDGALARVL